MARETAFIGFGSNLGDRLDFCNRALTLLSLTPTTQICGVSSLYETEPVADVGDPGPEWFLNGVVRLETNLSVQRLFEICQEVERALGRDLERRRGPRTVDLDILLYGTQIVRKPTFILPHPRLHLRRFVLAPLVELAPDWQHPLLERTLTELLHDLTDSSQVRRLAPAPNSRYGSRPTCATGSGQA